jgi:hypothetical protein
MTRAPTWAPEREANAYVTRWGMLWLVGLVGGGCSKPRPPPEPVGDALEASAPRAVPSAAASASQIRPDAVAPADAETGADAEVKVACSMRLSSPPTALKDVPTAAIARAILPTLDPTSMVAKVTHDPKGVTAVRDCRGGFYYARWPYGAGDAPGQPVAGTVTPIARRRLPDGQEAVWFATTTNDLGACFHKLGLVAIVRLDGPRLVVASVGPWDPNCEGPESFREERLGGQTVFVYAGRGYGADGTGPETQDVYANVGGELRLAGTYCTRAPAFDPQAMDVAKPVFSDEGLTLQGTTWLGEVGRSKSREWTAHYALRDGRLVRDPVEAGAPRPRAKECDVEAVPDPRAPRPAIWGANRGEQCEQGAVDDCFQVIEKNLEDDNVVFLERGIQLYDAKCRTGKKSTRCDSAVQSVGPSDAGDLRAIEVLEQTCATGDALVCEYVGVAYERGFGVQVDRARAEKAYRDGCAEAVPGCCRRLGGDGGSK